MINKQNPKDIWKFIILILVVVASILAEIFFQFDIKPYQDFFISYPIIISGVIFVLLYVAISFFLIFASTLFKISAAILFGPYTATILVTVAELINAVILFSLSRFLGREFVEKQFKLKPKKLDVMNSKRGFWGAWAFRVNLLFPLRFIDLAYGLTSISFIKYFWAVLLSTPIRIFVQEIIFAGVGNKITTDVMATSNYIATHPMVAVICGGYLVVWIISTIFIVISKFEKKDRPEELPPLPLSGINF